MITREKETIWGNEEVTNTDAPGKHVSLRTRTG
jgi:hypothetical protein